MREIRVCHMDPSGDRLAFRCQGCETWHEVTVRGSPAWLWNGSLDLPTFTPSILVRGFSFKFGADFVCHSFVTDGRIHFLNDCTHSLAGRTLTLHASPYPYHLGEETEEPTK